MAGSSRGAAKFDTAQTRLKIRFMVEHRLGFCRVQSGLGLLSTEINTARHPPRRVASGFLHLIVLKGPAVANIYQALSIARC